MMLLSLKITIPSAELFEIMLLSSEIPSQLYVTGSPEIYMATPVMVLLSTHMPEPVIEIPQPPEAVTVLSFTITG